MASQAKENAADYLEATVVLAGRIGIDDPLDEQPITGSYTQINNKDSGEGPRQSKLTGGWIP